LRGTGIDVPDSQVVVEGPLAFDVDAGAERSLDISLAPRRPLPAPGALQIHCNDLLHPLVDLPLETDVRALAIETRLLAVADSLPLGEAATVVVTPAPQVHVTSGWLFFGLRHGTAPFDSSALVAQGTNFAALIPGERVGEGGIEYYVVVHNGVASTRDPPDSDFHAVVASPGSIATAPTADADGKEPAGRSIPIALALPRGSRFVDGMLFYRVGGGAAYDSVAIDSSTLTAVVPGDSVGPRGVEYWARATTLSRVLYDPAQDPAGHPRVVRTDVASLAEEQAHAGEHYRMMSVPLELELPSAASLEAILSDQPEFG